MVAKVVLAQFVIIQIIFAHTHAYYESQNEHNNLANIPLGGRRWRRQLNNLPTGIIGNENTINGFDNGLPFKNGMPFSNMPFKNCLQNGIAMKNGLPEGLAFNRGWQNNLAPNNGLAFNNGLPNAKLALKNRLQNGFASNNGLPNGFPLNNGLPNGLPLNNGFPNGLPLNNGLPNGLPLSNGLPNGLPLNNGLPNGLPLNNGLPNGLPLNNGLPNGFQLNNRLPNGLPLNNGFSNGLQPNNGLPNNFNVPINGVFPNSLNNNGPFGPMPRDLANINISPGFNELQNINNVPANNLNNLATGNVLLNGNNLPVQNDLPSINNFPFENNIGKSINNLPNGNFITNIDFTPVSNSLNQNGLPNNNIQHNPFAINQMSSMMPNANFQMQIGNQLPEPINNLPFAGRSANTYNLNQNELASLNNLTPQNLNNMIFSGNNLQEANNQFLFNEIQNSNSIPINNAITNTCNDFSANNMLATNQQLNNRLAIPNNMPLIQEMANMNSFPGNAPNGMPFPDLNNWGVSNNGLWPASVPDCSSLIANNLPSNLQFQVNNSPFDFAGNVPANHNLLSSGLLTSLLGDFQNSGGSFNLGNGLVNNLQIEGFGNLPIINGLPVAGITESVTVLNNQCP